MVMKELKLYPTKVTMRFVAISLSKFADNLVEGIHKIKCKGCGYFLEYESGKNNFTKY